jgi:hypothetical protein
VEPGPGIEDRLAISESDINAVQSLGTLWCGEPRAVGEDLPEYPDLEITPLTLPAKALGFFCDLSRANDRRPGTETGRDRRGDRRDDQGDLEPHTTGGRLITRIADRTNKLLNVGWIHCPPHALQQSVAHRLRHQETGRTPLSTSPGVLAVERDRVEIIDHLDDRLEARGLEAVAGRG